MSRSRPRIRRRRGRGPSAKVVLAAAVVVGLLSAFASLLMPVHVDFADDPILRLQTFEARPGGPVSQVDCGNAFDGMEAGGGEEPAGIYELARDSACRDAATRRALLAGAAGAVLVVMSALAVTAASTAGSTASTTRASKAPPRPEVISEAATGAPEEPAEEPAVEPSPPPQ